MTAIAIVLAVVAALGWGSFVVRDRSLRARLYKVERTAAHDASGSALAFGMSAR